MKESHGFVHSVSLHKFTNFLGFKEHIFLVAPNQIGNFFKKTGDIFTIVILPIQPHPGVGERMAKRPPVQQKTQAAVEV